MTKYQIPEAFLPGFLAISKLDTNGAEEIGLLLNHVPIGANSLDFREIFIKAGVPENLHLAVDTIYSLGALLAGKTGDDIDELANGLSKAFEEKNPGAITDEEVQQLKRNLVIILKNGDNLKKTFKAYQLLLNNVHIFRDSKVNSDIRLLFNDELESNPGSGLILHQLKIEYEENEEPKSFFVSLDREDLIALGENLQRALKKEESIMRNHDSINFITVK
jgi:hypothetical protein